MYWYKVLNNILFIISDLTIALRLALKQENWDLAEDLILHGANCQDLRMVTQLPPQIEFFKPLDSLGRNGIYDMAQNGKLDQLKHFSIFPVLENQMMIGILTRMFPLLFINCMIFFSTNAG